MTNYLNCMNQQPPSYSGVTINVTNPALNMPPQYPYPYVYSGVNVQNGQLPAGEQTIPIQNMYYAPYPPVNVSASDPQYINKGSYLEPVSGDYNSGNQNINNTNIYQTVPQESSSIPQAYPQGYYVNAYNSSPNLNTQQMPSAENTEENNSEEDVNTDTSKEIISELDERNAAQKELEKNGQKTKIVALTNEYIMSLENYLNNPNTDIRLMAAKEVLTRLDEDKNRYDDAALNALLNKMLQDPNKIIRVAAMSAFSSGLASGNDYTVQLLNQIQQNPDADPEDVLEASQILLKRASTTEVVYSPVNNNQQQKVEGQE